MWWLIGIIFMTTSFLHGVDIPKNGEMKTVGTDVVDQIIKVNIGLAPTGRERAKTKILLVLTNVEPLLTQLVTQLKSDLERSGQAVAMVRYGALPNKITEVEALYKEGYPFVVFLALPDQQIVEGRLYDALSQTMLQGKKWYKREPLTSWAHKIAQDIWQQLMGDLGSFNTSIAYIKKVKRGGSNWSSSICTMPWGSAEERVIRSGNRIMIAPCWKHDGSVLFFSEFTDRNVRLMATNLTKKAWVVVDGDGTSVGVSCIPQVEEVVYCHSGDIWSYRYDPVKKRGAHTLLIKNQGEGASPTQLKNGDIIYCAHGKICFWSKATGKSQVLTEGYCTGPTVHEKSGVVVYSKRANRVMQLFAYDLRTKRHTQLTFDVGDKIDPSVSPCGAFVAYCCEKGRTSEIVVLTRATGTMERISKVGDFCSCPAWSPVMG